MPSLGNLKLHSTHMLTFPTQGCNSPMPPRRSVHGSSNRSDFSIVQSVGIRLTASGKSLSGEVWEERFRSWSDCSGHGKVETVGHPQSSTVVELRGTLSGTFSERNLLDEISMTIHVVHDWKRMCVKRMKV